MYLIIALYFCAPIFAEPLAPGQSDWDQHLFFAGQVLKNVIEYGSAPFWSPWYCGGNVMWQNPQVALLSPAFLLATLVPLTLAMKLNIVLHYWIGFIGMHLLITRAIGLSFLPLVIFLSTLFIASGAIVFHLQEGHSIFLPIMYLPLMLMCAIRALQSGRIRDTLLAGSLLALTVWNGGVHVLPGILLPVSVLVVIAAVMTRRWRPLILGACLLVSGLAYAAPKILPVGLFVTGDRFEDSRDFPHPDAVSVWQLPDVYLNSDRDPADFVAPSPWAWHEYGNYVGTFPVIMLIAGLAWALWHRRTDDRWLGLGLAVATLFLFSLSLGEFADWAPASLAHLVPGLSSFRIPSRYTMFFLLFATSTLAWTLRSAQVHTFRKVRVVAAVLCLISSAHLIEVNRGHWRKTFHEAPLDTSFQWGRSPSSLATDATSSERGMLRALVQDRLVFNCLEPLQLRRTARPDRPLVFSDSNSTLQVTRFQPNRIEFTVANGSESTRVYLNTNWSPGWHTNAGTLTVPDDTPPFVTLAAGQSGAFAFWFVPEGLWFGVAVMAAAMFVSIGAWRMRI